MSKLLKQAMGNAAALRPGGAAPDLSALIERALDEHQKGNLGAAAMLYGQILDRDPDNFDAQHLLGVAAYQSGNHSEALDLLTKAIKVHPGAADAYSNRSAVFMALGRFEEALTDCLMALQIAPGSPDVEFNAGNALAMLGRREEAVEHYRRALATRPFFVACLTNLGSELLDLDQLEEARELLEKAIEQDAHHTKALLNLGVYYQQIGRPDMAKRYMEEAVKVEPRYSRAHANLSNLALSHGDVTSALRSGLSAVAHGANTTEGHNCLGNVYRAMGMPREACVEFEAAIGADPSATACHSNLVLSMLADPTRTREQIGREAVRYGTLHAPWRPAPPRPSGSPERIGFVSPDFRTHPVGFFLEPLLANWKGPDVVLYSNSRQEDGQTRKLRSLTSEWRDIRHLDSAQASELVRQDGIDILIDLAGHTADGRLDVFAQRPAPVQLSWLGYSGTTGLSQFDALIADPTVIPVAHEDDYSEPIYRLPHSFACLYDLGAPDLDRPKQSAGPVTFGSFNATSKVNSVVVEAWSRILAEVEGSRLLLKNIYFGDETVRQHYARAFESNGLDADRLTFVGQTSREAHWEDIVRADIALDSFPYTGATTALDCLWMGVPMVTLLGEHYAARMAASFIRTAGHPELVTNSVEDYVATAVALARDPVGLGAVRSSLRSKIMDSPLGDAEGFSRDFIGLLLEIWGNR
ncbi:MAG: tetratricopeptide repeat protein [Armatimonadetes bacterium]|nr:tetratricopeptide repeat protein [Armatimonadota bacterium]